MKANELRIGNWVLHKDAGDSPDQVFELVSNPDRDRINYIGADNYNPIPLTEEWLEKFGFEKRKLFTGDDCWVTEPFCIVEVESEFSVWLRFDSDQSITVNLMCVHQLQNLYFALTGEELELKDEA